MQYIYAINIPFKTPLTTQITGKAKHPNALVPEKYAMAIYGKKCIRLLEKYIQKLSSDLLLTVELNAVCAKVYSVLLVSDTVITPISTPTENDKSTNNNKPSATVSLL